MINTEPKDKVLSFEERIDLIKKFDRDSLNAIPPGSDVLFIHEKLQDQIDLIVSELKKMVVLKSTSRTEDVVEKTVEDHLPVSHNLELTKEERTTIVRACKLAYGFEEMRDNYEIDRCDYDFMVKLESLLSKLGDDDEQ